MQAKKGNASSQKLGKMDIQQPLELDGRPQLALEP